MASARDDREAAEPRRVGYWQPSEAEGQARLGSWEWYVGTDQVFWSEDMYHIYGLPPDDASLPFQTFMARCHPDDYEPTVQTIRNALDARRPFGVDYRIIRPDGAIRTLHTRGMVVLDEDRQPVRIVGTTQDVTENRQLETVRQRAADILESISDAFVAVDRSWRLVYVNHNAARLLNRPSDGLLGRTLWDLAPQLLVAAHRETLERAMAERIPVQLEIDDPQRQISVEVRAYPTPDRLAIYIADVTERHRLEAQLRQAQRMEAVGRLAGGVAHDFNNLLTTIRCSAGFLLDGLPPDDPLLNDVHEIQLATDRAAALTQQLLAFSRHQLLEPKSLDLNAVVVEVERLLRRLVSEQIALVTRLDPAAGSVWMDRGQLQQVLLNLALNARDAMPNGGTLTIQTEPANSFARLVVRDTGVGMDPAVLARAFEPFFTTKEFGRGVGLGLATVYGIVKQSGGEIEVQSEPGVGTTFQIVLPRRSGETRAGAEGGAANPNSASAVLLVEDDPAVRSVIRRVLQARGYRMLEAGDGVEALRVTREYEGPIDLVISDVVMPQMGGWELANQLRDERPDTKVLLMSGYVENAELARNPPPGQIAVLPKPFLIEDLLHKVQELLALRR